jgi:stalled ribosome rescue protein Dom34
MLKNVKEKVPVILAVWLLTTTVYIKINNMANQKQFGIWMDTQHATIVGKENMEVGELVVLSHEKGEEVSSNSSEKTSNNQEKNLQEKFFKEIAAHLQNATHIHVTGTGQAQEQFIHYLAETPQFKNTKAEQSTSTKMSDEKLLEFMKAKLN